MRRGIAVRLGLVVVLGAWAGLFLVSGCASQEPSGSSTKPASGELTIAVIPKGTMHVFWKSVHAGAAKAERELKGVKIIWKGPVKEDEREAQIQVVETFITKRVNGIVLAPLDDNALVQPVHAANEAGIKVVIFDSDLKDPDAYVSFVATDNRNGGTLAAQEMARILGDAGGKVILLRYAPGSASTTNREQGFLDEIKKLPKLEVISSEQYAGATVGSAMEAAETLLTKYGEGKVDGIFCPNESSAYGMLQALRNTGRAGKVKFIGFDSSEKLVDALEKGHMHATVVQNPFKMGYLGVKTCVDALRGQAVEKRIDTGCAVVTPENLKSPEIQALINPPLKEYLNE
jgi:ribose transport system substrate-binding protein